MTVPVQKSLVTKLLDRFVEPVAFIVLFYLTINRIIFGGGWISLQNSTVEKVFLESVLWIMDGALILWIASQKKNLSDLLTSFKKNWILIVFILYSIISLLWSKFLVVSLFKVWVLIFCSFIAAYIGITYSIKDLLRKLSWFVAIIIGYSILLAIFLPHIGLHTQPPHLGAWRGIFFAKNYTGTIMALSSLIFLFGFTVENKINNRINNSIFFFLSIGLVFLSKSATGIIALILLLTGFFSALAWIKWRKSLSRGHYLLISILVFCGIYLVFTNLEFVFSLLNRNTTLTGRLPLWSFLVDKGIAGNPFFGTGIGAAWIDQGFRLSTQKAIGWPYSPIVSDNGWIDLFLNLGGVGVFLGLTVMFFCIYRVIIFAIKEKTIISFFPMFLIVFVLLVNISLSFLLELESFGWFLLVLSFFATTPIKNRKYQSEMSL